MKLRTKAALAVLSGLMMSGGANAQALTQAEAKSIAIDAYVYGYSLITTEVTRVQMSNVSKDDGALHGPMGQFMNVPRYPPADYRGVSAPNADTLYSAAWIDLGKEPTVFSHPDMGTRYFLFPMYSLWMPVIQSAGSRTTGEKAGKFLLTGPGWTGEVPAGMTQVKSPTRYMLILGRTYANGTDADYKAVNALQAEYSLRPLSQVNNPNWTFTPPPVDPNPGFSMTDKPQEVISALGTKGYFDMMNRLMCKDAPPAPEDAAILAEIAKIGVGPCKTFDPSVLDAATEQSLPKDALAKIDAEKDSLGKVINGWVVSMVGAYGTNYMQRAVVGAFGWPANLKEDAVYPYTTVDSAGATLNGANKYTLTFAKGMTPPADGFWSITMYEIDGGWWFVPNALNKFTVSLRDHPVLNADGSMTLYFQNESPGKDKEANWLPAPKGDFIPMLRMYWPKPSNPSILDGTWTPPSVVKAQ